MSSFSNEDHWTPEQVKAYEGLCAMVEKTCNELGITHEEFGAALVYAAHRRRPWYGRLWSWLAVQMWRSR